MKIPKQRFLICLSSALLMLGSLLGYAEPENDIEAQHIQSAKGYMNARQWSYANYEWRAALAVNPLNVDANIGLAETLMQSGFQNDALQHLERVRKSIDKLSIELTYAKALEQSRNYVGAVNVYLGNLQRVPLEPNSFFRLIVLLPQLPGKQQNALQKFLDQKASLASQSGRMVLKSKNYPDAIKNFKISTAYYPNLEDLNDYGVALLLTGQYDDALQQFNLLKKAQPERWEYYANSALSALGKGRSAEAARNVEQAITLCSDVSKKPLLYNDLGFIYESQEKWPKARNAYERAIELNPRFTKAKLNLAYAYQKDRAYKEAIATYQDLLQNHSNNADIWNRLGFVYELANKERLALNAYKKAVELSPNEQEGYHNLAILYRKLGKVREADQAYKKVMAIEFAKMESGGKMSPVAGAFGATDSQVGNSKRDSWERLLDFVDVFFLQST